MHKFDDIQNLQNKTLIPLAFYKLVQFRNYAGIILGNESKKFAVYINPSAGLIIQSLPSCEKRPSTHTLINYLLDGLDAKVTQVILNRYEDRVFFARLFIQQEKNGLLHIADVDSRPSDAVILSLMYNIPIYCVNEVFEQTLPYED